MIMYTTQVQDDLNSSVECFDNDATILGLTASLQVPKPHDAAPREQRGYIPIGQDVCLQKSR